MEAMTNRQGAPTSKSIRLLRFADLSAAIEAGRGEPRGDLFAVHAGENLSRIHDGLHARSREARRRRRPDGPLPALSG